MALQKELKVSWFWEKTNLEELEDIEILRFLVVKVKMLSVKKVH